VPLSKSSPPFNKAVGSQVASLAELDRFLTAQLKKDEMSVSGSVGSGDVIGVEFLF
jgi:diaminopimelate decarboxylase